jgi:hypothetical protein
MQRPIQQNARVVTGEGPATAVGAVHAGCEAHNQQPWPRSAERRDRARMIIGMIVPDLIEKSRQARAVAAIERKSHFNIEKLMPAINDIAAARRF